MPGLNFGIGGSGGAYGGKSGGTVGSAQVFTSPITGDMTTPSTRVADFPSTWVIGGAFLVMVVIYAHWRVY